MNQFLRFLFSGAILFLLLHVFEHRTSDITQDKKSGDIEYLELQAGILPYSPDRASFHSFSVSSIERNRIFTNAYDSHESLFTTRKRVHLDHLTLRFMDSKPSLVCMSGLYHHRKASREIPLIS